MEKVTSFLGFVITLKGVSMMVSSNYFLRCLRRTYSKPWYQVFTWNKRSLCSLTMSKAVILLMAEIRLTTWDVENPVNDGINYLSTGAGFQPSTVWTHMNWAQLCAIGEVDIGSFPDPRVFRKLIPSLTNTSPLKIDRALKKIDLPKRNIVSLCHRFSWTNC